MVLTRCLEFYSNGKSATIDWNRNGNGTIRYYQSMQNIDLVYVIYQIELLQCRFLAKHLESV